MHHFKVKNRDYQFHSQERPFCFKIMVQSKVINCSQAKKYFTLMKKSQCRHIRSITYIEEQRHVVDQDHIQMVLTEKKRACQRNALASVKQLFRENHMQTSQKKRRKDKALEIREDHFATMRGDFFGSKSSITGSSPGYCSKMNIQIKQSRTNSMNEQSYKAKRVREKWMSH